MAHGVVQVLSAEASKMVTVKPQPRISGGRKTVGVMGSRRIFPPAFKLKVLDSYRNDAECRGNQRATARKYGIHRRQIQKWLQCEDNLRKGCQESSTDKAPEKTLSPRLVADDVESAPSPPFVFNAKLVPQLPMPDLYRNPPPATYYANWTRRCEVKPYNGFYPETPIPNLSPLPPYQVKIERTCSPEQPVYAVKTENNEEVEEREVLKRDRESSEETDWHSSPTCSQEPPSPQGLSSYKSSSDSDAEADYSSSSSSTQHQEHLARRRSFSLQFKLDVLDAFHRDAQVAGNQRATAKKFNINRRQVQKWLGQESFLRDEIALRGGMCRQRLGSAPEPVPLSESPVDLRTRGHSEMEELRPACCDLAKSYYCVQSQEVPYQRSCTFSCCVQPCYQEVPPRKKQCLEDPRSRFCLSPQDERCCYESSAKHEGPPQEAPLCLVKSKTAIVAPSSNKDAILFKPYLDNPVSKPGDDLGNNNNNNNNNSCCKTTCNLNDRHDYALQFNLQVPVSWTTQAPPPLYTDLPQVRSAFVSYPASARFTQSNVI